MHRLHTETTRSSDYLLKTVLLLYLLRPAAARVAGYVTTRSRSVRKIPNTKYTCDTGQTKQAARAVGASNKSHSRALEARHYASNCLKRSL